MTEQGPEIGPGSLVTLHLSLTLEDGTEDLNKPLRCMPPFINVISNAPVTVDPEEMTCGIRSPIKFCLQTGGFYRECQICDAYQTGLVPRETIIHLNPINTIPFLVSQHLLLD